MSQSIRERLAEFYADDLLFLEEDEYDEAILGVVEQCGGFCAVCYDRTKLVEILCRTMDYEDAVSHMDYNVTGSYVGPRTPVFLDPLDQLG